MAMEDGDYAYPADIWSLGITVIEMAQTKPPLFEMNAMSALFNIPENDPPTLDKGADFSSGIRDFLSMCLRKNEVQRLTAVQLCADPIISGIIGTGHSKTKVQHMLGETTAQNLDPALAGLQSHITKTAEQLDDRRTKFIDPEQLAAELDGVAEATAPAGSRGAAGKTKPSGKGGKISRSKRPLSLHAKGDAQRAEEKTEQETEFMKKMKQKSMKNPNRPPRQSRTSSRITSDVSV